MRVLFFLHPGTNSRDIFLDMSAGFRKAGAEVVHFELAPIWQAQRRDANADLTHRQNLTQDFLRLAASFIQSNRIDISIGMWANALTTFIGAVHDGKPCSLFDAIDSPHMLFWLDSPHWAHEGSLKNAFPTPMFKSPRLLHLINNESSALEMTRVFGFANVLAQAYGVNEDVFRPCSNIKPCHDIVFGLGPGDRPPTELMARELTSDDPDVEAIRTSQARSVRTTLNTLVRGFDSSLQEPLNALFDRLIELQLANRNTPMLDRLDSIIAQQSSFRPAVDALLRRPAAFIEATAALRDIENWERAFTITWLSQRFNCAIFGSPTLDGWDCRAKVLGHVPYSQQSSAYASGRIGLNVMRWQDDIGTNIKPFEITASGVPCLMSHRATLEQHFEVGRELLTFRNLKDAKSLVQSLILNEPRRAEIAQAGLARTLRDHTWTSRARNLMCVFDSFKTSKKLAVAIAENKPVHRNMPQPI